MKTTDGLSNGRVIKVNQRFNITTECHVCGKKYDVKAKTLHFKHSRDGKINLICDACMESWSKSWRLKTVTEFVPDPYASGQGTAKCVFEDGHTLDYRYGEPNLDIDIPDHFFDSLAIHRKAYWEAKQAVLIKSLEVIDTFDTQRIICTQNNGSVTTLDYRVGVSGLIFDERQIAKVDAELLKGIKERLASEYNLYVGGAK